MPAVHSSKLLNVLATAILVLVAGNFRLLYSSVSTTTTATDSDNVVPWQPNKDASLSSSDQLTTTSSSANSGCHNATFLQELIAKRSRLLSTSSLSSSHRRDQQHKHWPTFFKERASIDKLTKRGNIINPRTGCHLARWVVRSPGQAKNKTKAVVDCHVRDELQKYTSVSAFSTHDTLYVPFNALATFCRDSLPQLQVDIVVITGQWQSVTVPNWNDTFAPLLQHEHVMHIFVMHKTMYAPHATMSDKISSWPLGINWRESPYFRKELSKQRVPKSNQLFVSHLSNTSLSRNDIPSSHQRLSPNDYYRLLHASQFILAPSGRRPDSFRMYEAIGLGAIPMTNLQQEDLPHFCHGEEDSIIFGVTQWTLDDLQCYMEASAAGAVATLSSSSSLSPAPSTNGRPNRRLVFEEYWAEYVERIVGVPLQWWDNKEKRVARLDEMASSLL